MDKAFRIPELVRLICALGEPADSVHLALTCRGLFTQAIPVAWADVCGVSQLLVLIKGATCDEIDRVLGGTRNFPEDLDETSLSRFGFYASFVTSLEIYKYGYQQLSVPQHQSLIWFIPSQKLLPNLTRLSIASMQASTKDCIMWIDLFSCPSLSELRIPCMGLDNFPSVSYAAASRITSTLYRDCPRIQKLELFWDPSLSDSFLPSDEDIVEEDADPNHSARSVYEFLSQYSSLTSIIGGMSLLECSMLLSLGSLPELQHLEVHLPAQPMNLNILDHPIFPPHSFPKLDSLVLCNAGESNARSLWQISALVSRLQFVTIKFLPPDDDDAQEDLMLYSFIPLLCTQSPRINELVLDFNCEVSEADDDTYIYKFTEDALNILAKLKLARLEVIHARVSSDVSLERLVTAWPDVETLRWPDQSIKLSDLPTFLGHLRKLKHLALEINLSPPLDEVFVRTSTGISQCQLRTLESSFRRLGHLDGDLGCKLYWYLRELIPNAKLQTRPDPHLDSQEDRKFDLACVNAINIMERFLKVFETHAPSEDEEKTRGRVGFVWDTVRLNTLREIKPGELGRMLPSQTTH